MSINMKLFNTVLSTTLLLSLFNASAEDIRIKSGEVPNWNKNVGITRYTIQFDKRVWGFIQIWPGNTMNAGSVKYFIGDREEYKWVKSQSYQKAARVYPVKVKVFIDDKLFIEQVDIDKFSTYTWLTFPYRPNRLMVKSLFSDGESYQMAVNINEIAGTMEGYDVRKKPMSEIDEQNKVFVTGLGGVSFSCISSKKAGPIKRITSVLLKHPIFAPNGNRKLGTVNIKIPIYELILDQNSYLQLVLTGEERYGKHTVTIRSECETVSGKTFKAKRDFTFISQSRSPFGS